MRVTDILRQKGDDVATISPDASLAEAAEVLSVRRVGALVVSADGATIDGIISERDLVRSIAERGPDALAEPVRRSMTLEVHTCGPDDFVDHLASVMTERRFRHLPVVVDGRLGGIVSIGDVVKRRVSELEFEARQLTEYIQTGR